MIVTPTYNKNNEQKQCDRFFFFLVFFSLLLCPHIASASSFFYLSASNINIEKENINLDLYLSITTIDDVEKMMKNGASIEITCDTELLRKQALLPSPTIETLNLVWLLQYDPLTREFLLYANNILVKRERDIKKTVDSIFFPLSLALSKQNLDPKTLYSIELQLKLKQAKIPSWIEKTLFFWNWDIMATSYSFDFILSELYQDLVLNEIIIDSYEGDDNV